MKSAGISAEIFQAASIGDQDAILRVLKIAQPDVRRYARTACRTASDAEDAAQEALWLIFRHFGTIHTLLAFPAWLFKVVSRECARLARKVRQTEPIEEADERFLTLDRPEEELRLDLAAAFESLPQHYRDVALMRDVKEMSIGEIANSLGLTQQAVKARLHRARLMTREFLIG